MLGIRAEDKNEWERRAPLTPDHVSELVHEKDLEIRLQPSSRRVFPDVDYQRAGARLDETLADCGVILGIKEIPEERLLPGKTYLFFSHTTKGQTYNMGMLRRLLELGCTLIDFELIVDQRGRRLIFFGRHAGYAGMIDGLWALGRRLAVDGISTPLERVRLAHDYSSLDEATHHISRVGEQLRHTGLPEELRPLVCGFTGSGNVARGAWEIFERLPTLEIDPEELAELCIDRERPRKVLYQVRFTLEHRVARSGGGRFDADEFREHPERYHNRINEWLPYLTLFVHGSFWNPGQPRLVRCADLRALWQGGRPRLRVIADISCDIEGGIEATLKTTTPGDPVFVYDVDRGQAVDGLEGRGPVIMSMDNLPCQLPAESSEHFGDTLVRFAPMLARCDWTLPLGQLQLPEEARRAIVAHQGKLAPRFAFLEECLRRA